jgi:hypothetical protein
MTGPLGPAKKRPVQTTAPTESWKRVEGKPWLEVNTKGQLRTCGALPPLPPPKGKP